jgi:hypothetical protein
MLSRSEAITRRSNTHSFMNQSITIRTNANRVLLGALSVLTFGILATANSVQGQGCDLYPIALSAQSLANVQEGATIRDIFNGTQPGNFGWLSWAGSPDEPVLVRSLSVPGDSSTYVNPDDANDHVVGVGDWVTGKPGVSNSIGVRDALDELEDYEIVVPVWDQVRAAGSNAAYHVSAFARVRILGYRLPGQNRISAVFIGYVSCGETPPV